MKANNNLWVLDLVTSAAAVCFLSAAAAVGVCAGVTIASHVLTPPNYRERRRRHHHEIARERFFLAHEKVSEPAPTQVLSCTTKPKEIR